MSTNVFRSDLDKLNKSQVKVISISIDKSRPQWLKYLKDERYAWSNYRTMSKLGFQKDFVRDFQKVYGQENLLAIKNVARVEHIDMALWKAAPTEARVFKQELRQLKKIGYGRDTETEFIRESFRSIAATFASLSGAEPTEQQIAKGESTNHDRSERPEIKQPKKDKGYSRGM